MVSTVSWSRYPAPLDFVSLTSLYGTIMWVLSSSSGKDGGGCPFAQWTSRFLATYRAMLRSAVHTLSATPYYTLRRTL